MLKEKPLSAEYRYFGIDISCTDGEKTPPKTTPLEYSAALEWFQAWPEEVDSPSLRLLACQKISGPAVERPDELFPQEAVKHAFWKADIYKDMAARASGGCAAFPDAPLFMLQTPRDGLPFMSMAMAKVGTICKGIYVYDDPEFEPGRMIHGEIMYSGWRGEGLQIVSMPQAVLKTSSAWISRQLTDVLETIGSIEKVLTDPLVDDYSSLLRTLHHCHDQLISMERRAGFEQLVADAVLETTRYLPYSKRHGWSGLSPWEAACKIRKTDLATIPRRIENARAAVNDSIFQRTQLQSLAIARATQRIAEATMKDSAAMKTIAVMTMLWLPSTAVASFFSMTMWNWEIPSGTLVSSWIWLYFVVAVPMTAVVILVWWLFTRRRERELRSAVMSEDLQPSPPYTQSRRYSSRKLE